MVAAEYSSYPGIELLGEVGHPEIAVVLKSHPGKTDDIRALALQRLHQNWNGALPSGSQVQDFYVVVVNLRGNGGQRHGWGFPLPSWNPG